LGGYGDDTLGRRQLMSEREKIEGELEEPSESEPNPTQERMDELGESESQAPVDEEWEEGGEA
jgi:hypothetical protein